MISRYREINSRYREFVRYFPISGNHRKTLVFSNDTTITVHPGHVCSSVRAKIEYGGSRRVARLSQWFLTSIVLLGRCRIMSETLKLVWEILWQKKTLFIEWHGSLHFRWADQSDDSLHRGSLLTANYARANRFNSCWFPDIGKWFPDIGNSVYFPISGNEFPISGIDFRISRNGSHFPISGIISRYREIYFLISGNNPRYPDIRNSNSRYPELISRYRELFPDIGNLISRYREIIPDIGKCSIKTQMAFHRVMHVIHDFTCRCRWFDGIDTRATCRINCHQSNCIIFSHQSNCRIN